MSRARARVVVLTSCLLFAAVALAAEAPPLTGRVVDTAQVLSAPARSRIEAALVACEGKTTKPGLWAKLDRAAENAIYYTVWSLMLLVLGYFTFRKATSPGGWLAYVFFAPLWWVLPAILIGPTHAWIFTALFLAGYPVAKLTLRRTEWYRRVNAPSRG
jgi:hypothetical protein